MNQEYDLLIYGGRLIDPAQHIDAPRDIAIQAGKVAAVDQQLPHGHARQLYDATGRVVTPGLIDLHTHVFKGLHIAVDADAVGRNSGVTTMVDTGSSGAANFSLFRDHIIPKTKVRIIPFLNIWITGASMATLPGETHFDGVAAAAREGRELPKVLCYFDDVRYASCEAALATIQENRELIAGVKVWVNCLTARGSLEPLYRAKDVANQTGLPVMVCTYFGPPTLKDIVPVLGHGDIQTHFCGIFTGLMQPDGQVIPEAVAARERGVIFDIGHGAGSFDFEVARQALAAGFGPDTISTDIHTECIDGPVFDLPTTMAKFTALGMRLYDVVQATTARPAEVLGLQDQIGSLRPGLEADLAIFDLVDGDFDLVDTQGHHLTAGQRLVNVRTIKAGEMLN